MKRTSLLWALYNAAFLGFSVGCLMSGTPYPSVHILAVAVQGGFVVFNSRCALRNC